MSGQHHEISQSSTGVVALSNPNDPQLRQTVTLGSVRLHDANTGNMNLIPQPSEDPDDPLRWSRPFKLYVACVTCLSLTLVNFFGAGPAVALLEVVHDLFGATPPDPTDPASLSPESISTFRSSIKKAALLYSSASLVAGVSNLFWVPLAVNYGRRTVNIGSFLMFSFCCIWAANASSYPNLFVARMFGAWFSGSMECVAPMTIADVFFLHERGRMMAMFSSALSNGASLGLVVAGLFSISQTWDKFYYLTAALAFISTGLMFFIPETAFNRSTDPAVATSFAGKLEVTSQVENASTNVGASRFRYFDLFTFNRSGPLTRESTWKIAFRPLPLIILPPILWSSVSFGIGIGIFVIMSTTVSQAFAETYGFTTWQIGLVWLSSVLGNLLGIPFGGHFSDWIANRKTLKNDGIREPEMRLPAVSIAMIAYPGSLLLYGLGIHFEAHWMVPVAGIFLFSLGSSAAIGISVVYTVDCYRPIAGEVTVTQITFKSAVTFLMAFYANPWVTRNGYAGAFSIMAGISFVILALWVPLYIWGKRIRLASLKWRAMKLVFWSEDRETGE